MGARRAFTLIYFMCQMHPFLVQEALLTTIHALITSQLDYYIVLYLGLSLKTIWKLQQVQNSALRAIFSVLWFAHMISLLYHTCCTSHSLIWVQFRLLVINFKTLNNIRPGDCGTISPKGDLTFLPKCSAMGGSTVGLFS